MVVIRNVTLGDAERICEIYNYYVLQTTISFEVDAVSETEIYQRISDVLTSGYPYWVYEADGRILGYCYLSSWKGRCAYRTTAEVSVYIDKDYTNQGIGSKLMKNLFENVDMGRFHTIIASIALPNEASVALHEKFGFTRVSYFREIGYKFQQWQDVGHWQLILESKIKVLILCTGNSCRSQMAHGFLQSFDKKIVVCSAGTKATGKLNDGAVKAMAEVGIDISSHTSDPVEKYIDQEWDYVITVCGGANETCPMFAANVKHRLHIGFDDPSHVEGTSEFIESEYRRVRDEIKNRFYQFYIEQIKGVSY